RSSLLEVLGLDYIKTARSKGLTEQVVVYRHALKNALIPVITILGLEFGTLLGGAIITETVFSWPGVGRLIITAINQRDFPLVVGAVTIIATLFVFLNLVVDLLYGVIDPRVRYS
nr:ABC transporter permease [Chloroflexia bacterium]